MHKKYDYFFFLLCSCLAYISVILFVLLIPKLKEIKQNEYACHSFSKSVWIWKWFIFKFLRNNSSLLHELYVWFKKWLLYERLLIFVIHFYKMRVASYKIENRNLVFLFLYNFHFFKRISWTIHLLCRIQGLITHAFLHKQKSYTTFFIWKVVPSCFISYHLLKICYKFKK